jgi:hypothetical protein
VKPYAVSSASESNEYVPPITGWSGGIRPDESSFALSAYNTNHAIVAVVDVVVILGHSHIGCNIILVREGRFAIMSG